MRLVFVSFFDAPYGRFINWKTSNGALDDVTQLQSKTRSQPGG